MISATIYAIVHQRTGEPLNDDGRHYARRADADEVLTALDPNGSNFKVDPRTVVLALGVENAHIALSDVVDLGLEKLEETPPRDHRDETLRGLYSAHHPLTRAERLGEASKADLSVLRTIEQLIDVMEAEEGPDRSDFYLRLNQLTAQMVALYDEIQKTKAPKGKSLAEIEAEILRDLPEEGCVEVGELVGQYSTDPSGYGTSNARAALLALQEHGKVTIHDDGHVSRKKA